MIAHIVLIMTRKIVLNPPMIANLARAQRSDAVEDELVVADANADAVDAGEQEPSNAV